MSSSKVAAHFAYPVDPDYPVKLKFVMILMIDNFDSFTYNLVQYLGEMGEELVVKRNDEISLDDIAQMQPDQIIVSPGPCSPNEAGISVATIQQFAGKIPILGVCLGHQSIGQAFGGNVVRADRLMHGKTSPVFHDNKTIFEDMPEPFAATRYHSLLIERSSLPDCLEISAETEEAKSWACATRNSKLRAYSFTRKASLPKTARNCCATSSSRTRNEQDRQVVLTCG
jgi:anthranilate synthase/aminodeoxychorismate synthase-like glutamine amidotransferase